MGSTHLSVVIPTYACQGYIQELYKRLKHSLEEISSNHEIIFVNDASPQADWELISQLCKQDPKVKGINFSKNFGQHYAMTAGIDYAKGDWVLMMDADLEDAPEEIYKLYNRAQEGFQIVYGTNIQRGGSISLFKRIISRSYYAIYDFLCGNGPDKSHTSSFVLFNRTVANSYKSIRDKKRQFGPLLKSLGFNQAMVETNRGKDEPDTSSYTIMRRLELALTGIITNSTMLLKLGIGVGFFLSLCAIAYGAFLILRKLLGISVELGWTSTIASIFFTGGLLMIFNGILGLYIESIIYEVRERPIYIVKEVLNI